MNSNFVAALRAKLREDMNTYADDMAGGACKSFEEYQKCCGGVCPIRRVRATPRRKSRSAGKENRPAGRSMGNGT